MYENGFQPLWHQLWVNNWPTLNTKKEEKKEVSPYQEKVLSYIKMECFQLSDEGFGTIIFFFLLPKRLAKLALFQTPSQLGSSTLPGESPTHLNYVFAQSPLSLRMQILEK